VTSRRVVAIGLATSVGTHHAGQDQAPAALRAAGFLDRLGAEGVTVEDRGDLLHAVFVPDGMASTDPETFAAEVPRDRRAVRRTVRR
jgi:arginase family enzyme